MLSFGLGLILSVICLSSSAQYQAAVKGDLVGFDSAVIVRLDKYRQIRLAVLDAPGIIDSLESVLRSYQGVNEFGQLISNSYEQENKFLYQVIDIRDEEIRQKDELVEKLRQTALDPPKPTFWQKSRGWVAGGAIGIGLGLIFGQ